MLFGTSGIRGLYARDITEELALKIGNLFSDKNVIIGRDIRNTGESLSNAVISGVLSTGKDAISLGIVPTPTLALATKKFSCNGIMLTASHNPSEYNGLKLFSNGLEISRKKENEIEERYSKNELKNAKWDSLGKLTNYKEATQDHKNLIKNLINSNLIKSKKPKVIIDCNGPASLITPSLLEELGCKVISIHTSLEEFERKYEHNKENLKKLSEMVIKENADLGIGHDGDADRSVVVDEKGEVLPLDIQLALMIEYELEKNPKNKKIITTAEASLCVLEAAEKNNAKLFVTPVGSLYISEMIEKENALFGGEPCGEYVFKEGIHVPDGILTAAKFVELFCKKGPLSKLKENYKTYSMLREKFPCDNSKKYSLVQEIKSKIKTSGKIRDDDGIRVDEEDGWFLIRASGTEPYIRLTMEYKDVKKLEKMSKTVKDLIILTLK